MVIQSCTNCLLPETYETLTFDKNGICSVCNGQEIKQGIDWSAKSRELQKLVDGFKNKGDYDCIIPFSGGKDSTWTLYYVVNVLKLKPLVVSFDHGFYRDNLVKNREKVTKLIGVDVEIFTPNWKLVRRLMLQSFLEKGDFCWHCHTGIFSYPMWIAIEKNIPLIIWGEPSSEYTSYYSYAAQENVDEDRFNRINTLGITAEDMAVRIDGEFDARDFKPFTYPPREKLKAIGCVSIPLGSFIPWDVKKQVEIISSELGWTGDQVEGVPPGYEYEKIECYMQGVRDYIKYIKRGYSRTTHLMSIDIRNDRISREDALKQVEKYEKVRPASLDIFLEYTGLSEDEFMEIALSHKIDPWEGPGILQIGKRPPDFENLQLHDGLPKETSNRIVNNWRLENR
jgi:N-acetyl sugar amidotransferase